jgi:hypothetical protein
MAAIREKAKKFQKFVKGLESKHSPVLPDPKMPLLDRFIFYLLFYSNPVTYAKKAFRAFKDEKRFSGWNEVRVATVREIADILEAHKIGHANFLAPRIKHFLQEVFQEVDDTRLEPLREDIKGEPDAKVRKEMTANAKAFLNELTAPPLGIPPWAATYLLTGLEFETTMPWDPHTEAVLSQQKAFPAKSTLNQKKRVAKALLDGLEHLGPIGVHHLLVEHSKRDLKRRN